MRHRTGPSKKLAPTSKPETACPHEFTHDEGVQLEVDCDSCAGAHDLLSRNCLVGVVNAAAAGPQLDSIILRRMIHKRYRGDVVQLVMALGRDLSALNRAISSAQPPAERQCRTCSARKDRVLVKVRSRLLEDPVAWVPGLELADAAPERLAPNAACARAGECVRRALDAYIAPGGTG